MKLPKTTEIPVLEIGPERPPLKISSDRVALIGETRVTLDTLVAAFEQGSSAEEIVLSYPALKLAEVYGAIAFYLNHKLAVEQYLEARQQQARKIREINESRPEIQKIRERLIDCKYKQPC